MQTFQAGNGPLEDHMRNIILTNGHPGAAPDATTPDMSTSTGGLSSANTLPAQPDLAGHHTSPAQSHAPHKVAAKKRPNQAQRRQMNAQLSIPIATRVPAPSHARTYMNPQQFTNPQPRQGNPPQNAFHSQSVGHRGGFQDRAQTMNAPPFPTQRHHQGGGFQGLVPSHTEQGKDWRRQQPTNSDKFSRGVNVVSADAFPSRGRNTRPNLYQPGGHRQFTFSAEQLGSQSGLLERLCHVVIAGAEIAPSEIAEKENFRGYVEAICQDVITRYEFETNGAHDFQPHTVQLKCFGSLASGFATKAADMDLGLLTPMSRLQPDSSESPIPRLIEGALLRAGFGARLLTKTRVPIIKLCEKPSPKLQQDLLEERVKWERGLQDDDKDVEEDDPEDQDASRDTPSTLPGTVDTAQPTLGDQLSSSQPLSGSGLEPTHPQSLNSLRQSENQSLGSYYGSAKKLLRRLGGRDITQSNSRGFTEADFKLLDDVAAAFIRGLRDERMRNRISAYPSFLPSDVLQLPNYRTLFGAYTLIEGEELVHLWQTKTLGETTPKSGQGMLSERAVQWWNDLQYKKRFGAAPLVFNRDLQLAVESLRQIPSVQLVRLRQDPYESAAQYHARVVRIAADLRGNDPSSAETDISPQIIESYISGIRDDQVREDVRNFTISANARRLRTVARKHKSAHLAADYERAIDSSLYREENIPAIREYITVLRRDLVMPSRSDITPLDLVVPVTHSASATVAQVQNLPDPSRLGPNQPKDRYHDSLEFPKNGIGVQCDINFSAHLALQNTMLLRCYSYTDPRVRPLVLFVKHWAKARGINTPYRGTLSSYGYVLMVLHYLVNITEPFVCPNLQQLAPPDPALPSKDLEGITTCNGRNVRFWRDEQAIKNLAQGNQLNQNRESMGTLLRGFFEYYAQNNMMSTIQKRGFDWGRDVLSLRTYGGLLSKSEKGWTGAKTVMQLQTGPPPNPAELQAAAVPQASPADGIASQQATTPLHPDQPLSPPGQVPTPTEQPAKPLEFKEVRHRYLFAIEDPFELEHNVARTVTHNGIVSIRDEFRRAWRTIRAAGQTGQTGQEDLLEDMKIHNEQIEKKQFADLLLEIHGTHLFSDDDVDNELAVRAARLGLDDQRETKTT
ncbi:Uu.00g047200.m01.CDS01 [Anthostomella pinea]|uniref:polynucleotide adenylyltransferase n=1 Tax=Anthostomella pinea TaxID=933095 RepID=A0AAI8VC68_9PEZI|nr:Uu.00g047200.m01.CDS01 [Anthostomella pinea]